MIQTRVAGFNFQGKGRIHMTDEEIRQLVESLEITDIEAAVFMAQHVRRETLHRYFKVIQSANNAASDQSITYRDIDKVVFER